MDVQLPGMDGVEALGRLRADPATAALPVVALTAFAMKDDRERFLAAGFDGYLEKPIDVRALPRRRSQRCWPRGAEERRDRAPARSSSSTTCRRTSACSRRCSRRAAIASCRRRSGGEALERVAAEPVDLVLLDIVMPEMDGYEVCRALRADAGDAASCRS